MRASVDKRDKTAYAIRRFRSSDVGGVLEVHLLAFQGFFLTFLGPAFLRELYTAVATDSSGIGFVYQQNGEVRGFAVGTTQPSGFYSRLLRRRWWRFALASIRPAFTRPSIIPRVLRALTMPQHVSDSEDAGLLMSLAVSPYVRNRGIGRSLVEAFLQKAWRQGLSRVSLSTDAHDNDAVNRFYQKLGFVPDHSYTTPEGRAMIEYVISREHIDQVEGKDAN